MLDVRTEQVRDETKERRWFAFLLVNGGWWDASLLHGRGDSAGDFTACAEVADLALAGGEDHALHERSHDHQ